MLSKKRGPQVSAQQLEYLINFVCAKANTSVLTMKTTPCKETDVKKMWEKAAVEWNQLPGPYKHSAEWRRFFVELKPKTRAKARAFNVAQQKTAGGANEEKPLTPLEEKLMSNIGWVSITGCSALPAEIDASVPSTHIGAVLPNYDVIESENPVEMDELEIFPLKRDETEIIVVAQVHRDAGKNKPI